MPHLSNTYYGCSPSLQLISLTSPTSNHSKNVERNPQVAVSITDTTQLPNSKKFGLELIGTMRRAKGLEATAAYAHYFKRMMKKPAKKLSKEDTGEPMKLSKMMSSRPYVVDVSLVKVLDERRLPPDTFCIAEVKR